MAQLDKYKQAILEEYRSTNRNIFVSATAGSGKTFTLCELAKATPPVKECIFMAFNKSIASELQNRLPRTVKASTLHSYALSMLCKAFNINFAISEGKYFNFCKEKLDFKGIHPKKIPGLVMRITRLYDIMRFNLVFNDVAKIIELGERYGEEVNENIAMKAIQLHKLSSQFTDSYFCGNSGGKILIDFTDMLYYAAHYIEPEDFKRYNVVMVDEVQDIAPLHYDLVKRCRTPRGRLISVGDEKQSIYSFMGANLDSLNDIKNAPNTVCLPLSMTYRCSQAVVEEACTVFPDGIIAAPDAPKGIVDTGTIRQAKHGDFILCRNNAPLVDAFIQLIRLGKRCVIMGRELGDELVTMIDSVNDIYDFERILLDCENRLAEKGVKHPTKSETYDKLDEKVNILISLFEYFGDLNKVRSVIYDIFVENTDNNSIILSTIHKSKGLEADRVFFLKPELLPSPYATTELSLYAEKCLKFVGITRAKRELIYC